MIVRSQSSGLVAVQAVAAVELDEGVGDLAGDRPVGPAQRGGVPFRADAGPDLRRRDDQRRARQLGGLQPRATSAPSRSPAAISSAQLLARSCTACWQSRSDQRGWAARIRSSAPAGSRRAAATLSSTASASAAQSTLLGPGSSSSTR